jgi:hypothetical protein
MVDYIPLNKVEAAEVEELLFSSDMGVPIIMDVFLEPFKE